jgi:hypothetical protein
VTSAVFVNGLFGDISDDDIVANLVVADGLIMNDGVGVEV